MIMNNTLTRYAGLLTLPVAVAAVVVTAEMPRSLRAPASARAVHRATHARNAPGHAWLNAARDPFADEDIEEAALFEARMAAEDNLELI